MRSRILLGALFGSMGGFVGFAFQEVLTKHDLDLIAMSPADQMRNLMLQGLLVGAALGLAIGLVESVATGANDRMAQGALFGALIGAVGGVVGIYLGSIVFTLALFGKPQEYLMQSHGLLGFLQLVIARALGWTFLGALPGLAVGASTRSGKRAVHGLIGGLIGGFLGGVLFDLIGNVAAPLLAPAAAAAGKQIYSAGGPSRAVGFTVIGLLTGLFIGLVEEYFKQAWVRVLAGRNEGRDFIISKPLTIMGRDERADIPLFGDRNLAPQHAAIRFENGRHILLDGGTSIGTLVNGQRVDQPRLLRDGDMIQLGSVRILFREKATASRLVHSQVDLPASPSAPGAVAMPSHLCPYCGTPKDAQGNCLCTVSVAGAAGPSYAPPAAATPALGTPPAQPFAGGTVPPVPPSAAGSGLPGAPGIGIPPIGSGSNAPGEGLVSPSLATGSVPMGARFVGLEGPYAGQAFALLPANTTIGRDAAADIPLTADPTVSRKHAHVTVEGSAHVIYDDGSSNGTYVNGVRITTMALAPGSIVQVGQSKFRYE
ncbi:MAG: FHA domain-containing protein [Chthonomonadales bacterium]